MASHFHRPILTNLRFAVFQKTNRVALTTVSIGVIGHGGTGEIRTLARFHPPTFLAGKPLIASWVLLQIKFFAFLIQSSNCELSSNR